MKLLDLNKRISLVVTPIDMRCGWRSLNIRAAALLDIDVCKGEDVVVFISKTRKICRILGADRHGGYLLTRYLYSGTFQQLMTRIDSPDSEPLTPQELERYLDGKPIQSARKSLSYR